MQTPTTYRQALVNRLKKDLNAAKNYVKLCRQYIQEAEQEADEETAYFWAAQHDNAAQNIQAISYQLKTI